MSNSGAYRQHANATTRAHSKISISCLSPLISMLNLVASADHTSTKVQTPSVFLRSERMLECNNCGGASQVQGAASGSSRDLDLREICGILPRFRAKHLSAFDTKCDLRSRILYTDATANPACWERDLEKIFLRSLINVIIAILSGCELPAPLRRPILNSHQRAKVATPGLALRHLLGARLYCRNPTYHHASTFQPHCRIHGRICAKCYHDYTCVNLATHHCEIRSTLRWIRLKLHIIVRILVRLHLIV